MGNNCGCFPISPTEKFGFSQGNCTKNDINDLSKFNPESFSKEAFQSLNNLRKNPEYYYQILDSCLNKLNSANLNTQDITGEITKMNNEKSNLNNKDLQIQKEIFNLIKENEETFSILRELQTKLKSFSANKLNELAWNENLFKGIVEIEDPEHEQDYSIIFSKASETNLRVKSYTVEGYYEPDFVIYKLLIENKEKFNEILSDDYFYCLIFPHNIEGDIFKFHTDIYFMYEVHINEVLINGTNPMTGNYQPFYLTDVLFNFISYKEKIIGGSYTFTEEGLNICFNLYDGSQKEENIKFQNTFNV